jgi:multidrug efflux pump
MRYKWKRAMNSLINAAVDRWRTMMLLLGFLFVAGFVAYNAVPKEAAPDITIPYIYTTMTLEGISPEDAERLLVRPMEKKLQSVESVKEMTAQAYEGGASVTLEFEAGFNPDVALQDVRNAVDEAKPDLPSETDEPKVVELNFSKFPILNVSLVGAVDERILVRLARDLRDKIETISTVLEAQMSGDREEVLEVVLAPLALESYNLQPSEILTRISNNNLLIPAGQLDTGEGRFAIKLPGLIETARDLRETPMQVSEQGAVTTLSDIAEVRRGFKDVETYARVNGQKAIGLAISKRAGENIIETVDAVRSLITEEQQYWPPGIEVIYSNDESNRIRERVTDLQNNVILAVLLVAGVIAFVMGARSAALVAITIPGAFLFGVLCISLLGLTMNIVVLFALILSIGMLVDSAIVVCEYADRKMLDGASPAEAYPAAAARMAWPIIASTITTLVVFMPLLFWPGTVGEFMKFMPMTLILTLSGSLLMALLFLPMLGVRFGKRANLSDAQARQIVVAESGDLRELGSYALRYVRALAWALKHPKRVMGSISGAVVVLIAGFIVFGSGVEFFPKIEPENARLDIKARGNLSIDERDAMVRQVEELVVASDGVKTYFATAGQIPLRQETAEDTIGQINIEFADWFTREPADVILKDIRAKAQSIAGIEVETIKNQAGPPVGKAVQLEFASRFPDAIDPELTKVLRGMQELGGFINITDERPVPLIEWELEVDRELAGQYDISIAQIGQVVKFVTNGVIVSTYRPDHADDELDVIVRFPEENRHLGQLDRVRVNTPFGTVPIAQFVTRKGEQRVSTIRRTEGKRSIYIRADLEPGLNADAKVTQLRNWIADNGGIDERVQVRFRGEDEEQKEAGAFLGTAFLIAIFIMVLLLVTQFNSGYAMLVIMSAVVFSIGGVFLGLLVTGTAFGIVMCGVGVISLAGIVVNNNIIFIDTYKQLREGGMDKEEALMRTGAQRLRPILLTAGTTVLGLLPMVFQLNINFIELDLSHGAPSSQWWVQMSTAIAGGLTFATILTLFFTPCMLMVEDGVKSWRIWGGGRK